MKKKNLLYTAAAMAAVALLNACSVPKLSFETYESEAKSSGYTSEVIQEPTFEQNYSYSEAVNFGADKIYDALVAGLRNKDDVIKLDSAVDFGDVDLAVNMVIWYHPEIFWLSGYEVVNYRSSSEITVKYLSELNSSHIPSMSSELEAAANSIIAMIPPGSDTFGKIVFVHDYIVGHTDYNTSGALNALSGNNGLYGTAYGCLVQGDAICQGYALGFMYIMQKLGIECGFVSGECDRGSHAWNYVEINGINYWIDLTWDDPSYADTEQRSIERTSHSYCLVDDSSILRTRTINYDGRKIPVCSFMMDNYFYRNNAYFHAYDKDAMGAVLAAGASERSAEMMFSSKEVLEEAVDKLFKNGDIWEISDNISYSDSVIYSVDEDMYVLRLEY